MPARELPYFDNMDQSLESLRDLAPKSDASELHGVEGSDLGDLAHTGYQVVTPPCKIMSIASSQKPAPPNPWSTWNSGYKERDDREHFEGKS